MLQLFPCRPRLLAACAASTAVVAAALPSGAGAATVTREADGTLVYTAAPGEVNRTLVQASSSFPGEMWFHESSAPLDPTVPAGCTLQAESFWVACPSPPRIRVDLGDGDDTSTVSDELAAPVAITGGPGADALQGADGADVLDGGPGDDRIDGLDGADLLLGGDGADTVDGSGGGDSIDGGAGDDVLRPDGYERAAADAVEGGPGVDRIEAEWSSRFDDVDPPVAVTLGGGADDGRPGEGDDIRGVERLVLGMHGRFVGSEGPDEVVLRQVGEPSELVGLEGDDRLRGGDGADRLDGGPGADNLDGGFGDDAIVAGPGRDTISGDLAGGDCGPLWCKLPWGNDTIDVRDGEADSVSCGAGTDTVLADPADTVAPDCEAVTRAGAAPSAPAPVAGGGSGTARVRVAVVRSRLAAALRSGLRVRVMGVQAGTLRLVARREGRVVARGSARIPQAGLTVSVRLKFSKAAKRRLRGARRVTLIVSAGGARAAVTLRR